MPLWCNILWLSNKGERHAKRKTAGYHRNERRHAHFRHDRLFRADLRPERRQCRLLALRDRRCDSAGDLRLARPYPARHVEPAADCGRCPGRRGANWLLLFASYPHASISVATTVYNTQPFMLLGLGALFLGEKITVQKLFWLMVAFGGVVLIVQAKPEHGTLSGSYGIGILLALAAAFFYALAAFAAKWLKGTSPHVVALIHVLTGAVMLAPFADFNALPQTTGGWSILATIGVVHTGIMYILLYGAIQKLPVHLTGALSFIYPVASIAVDRIAFGHLLQPLQIAGSVLVLLAAAGTTLGWSWQGRLGRQPS
jgi:drug/metabolite transporter (DMT)-like permease